MNKYKVEIIRGDFPILEDLVYMDSASTSLTPEPVLNSIIKYYRNYNSNVGRGVHRLSQAAEQMYNDAHKKVARFIGAKHGKVVFTRNTTESINLVACGLRWSRGDKVVTTLAEHHSNFLPWLRLKRRGVHTKIIEPDRKGLLEVSDFESAIDDSTKLVALTHINNALGTVLPVKEISEISRDHGALLMVDGAQSVPHMLTRIDELKCDFLCFSGHKMLGPKGTGVLWTCQELDPLMVGGGMVEDMSAESYKIKRGFEGLEAGTPNISGGIGLGEAVVYLEKVGMEEIASHEIMLRERLVTGLQDMRGVEIFGSPDLKERSGIVSFNIKGYMPHEVALMLDHASSIMVRSGHHCCIPLMRHLELKHGTVRASLYLYNTHDEVDLLLATIREIAKMSEGLS